MGKAVARCPWRTVIGCGAVHNFCSPRGSWYELIPLYVRATQPYLRSMMLTVFQANVVSLETIVHIPVTSEPGTRRFGSPFR